MDDIEIGESRAQLLHELVRIFDNHQFFGSNTLITQSLGNDPGSSSQLDDQSVIGAGYSECNVLCKTSRAWTDGPDGSRAGHEFLDENSRRNFFSKFGQRLGA